FLNGLWAAASVLAASTPDRAPWRVALIKRLAQLMMTPQAPAPLRDRAMQALIQSNEPGIGLLFQQSVNRPDPFLRACAVLGLGALGREQDLPRIEAALADDDPDVRLAAVNALGLLTRNGSQAALEQIIVTMVESEGPVQQLAAEALAELEPAGYDVLRDAARDQDLMVRRAAVFGLAAVREPWAATLLREMQQDDDEWLVRNAAAEALDSLGLGEAEAALPELTLPRPETESWLIEWTAERGEGTGVGDAAYDTLIHALHEGEPLVRYKAAEALGRLAHPRAVGALRQHLRDPEPAVRDAALAALEEIARRHDITITAKA
ncbi:MAG TPA: hypothetical protein EYP10_03045, partial [Armatimonadetes bacterium]|nr:hypothetical protein [Armatimonadota bacterium]